MFWVYIFPHPIIIYFFNMHIFSHLTLCNFIFLQNLELESLELKAKMKAWGATKIF